MPDIKISVKNKTAIKTNDTVYVCGNSDFIVKFDFDTEWEEYETKTGRFSFDGRYIDVIFTGNECKIPVISDTYGFYVGVYAGNLHTTTPARVSCKKSILCGGGLPADPEPDVYAQLLAMYQSMAESAQSTAEIQSDWETTDETNPGYIRNRTHYIVPSTVITDDTKTVSANVFGNLLWKVSTLTPAKASIVGAKITVAGKTYTIDSSMITDHGTWFYVCYPPYPTMESILSMAVFLGISESGNVFVDGATQSYSFPSSGVYFFSGSVTELEYGGGVKRLDAKYLPESVESIILASSTTGSTKRFKITVSDDGTLTTTEVTE